MKRPKTYSGKPCKKCGGSERYLSTGGCATCARAHAIGQYMRFPEKLKSRRAKEYLRNLDNHRDFKLRATYGFSLREYNDLLEIQKGVCAICSCPCSSGRRLCVDHDHKNNKVRGLLCVNCNRAIGNLRDDPKLLRKAANYLEDHEVHNESI